jgi:outer membrane protein
MLFKVQRAVFIITLVGLTSSQAFAGKFGIIDMQAVILNVQEGKDARAALEKEIKAKEGEFNKRREELDKLNKDWQGQATLMSEEAKMNKQKEFQDKFMSLRNDETSFRDDVKKREQKATQAIAVKVESMVQKLAKEKSLEIVFEINSAGLLYVNQPVDLTKEVIDSYSKSTPKK